ncbi:hypothetical protein FDK12_09980 [Arthrobacter sp. NamB2]|uniref:hypothetical protein n=1 Tax=Arthrobacter sp. NamB2 TaxID=2576035 RepID=UPI0010C94FD2|nr:hypothetical protein [Arthrobacter sp. NamB2]TKV28271.1 hypothetical protein FDK12_09980 [Arthrobacter sp. NamB2]
MDELEGEAAEPGTAASSTGDARIDSILAVLDALDTLPVPEHAGVYAAVHERLSGELNPEQKLRQAGAHAAS